MKKRLLISFLMLVLLSCLFTLAVSAETMTKYIDFKVLLNGEAEYTTVYTVNAGDSWTAKLSLANDFYTDIDQTSTIDKTQIVKIDMSNAKAYGINNTHVKQVLASSDNTQYANVTEIKFPNNPGNFGEIGSSVCKGWTSLTTVDYGSAYKVGDNCFEGCTAFTNLIIPEQITKLNNYSFKGCLGITSVQILGKTTIDAGVFQGCTSLTDVNLVQVNNIGGSMFNGCTLLTEITIPETATSIGAMAFYNTSITSLHIPANVTSIGYQVAEDLTSLKTLTFAENSKLTYIAHRTFQRSGLNGEIVIPEGVTQIDYSAFASTAITSVKLPSTLTKLGKDENSSSVFSDCTQLASINLPEGLVALWPSTFKSCSSLTSIHIPASVTYIGYNCFDSATSLATITFAPNSLLEKIGAHGFQKTAITSIALPNSLLRIAQSTFNGCSNLVSVSLGASFVDFNAGNAGQPPFANGSTLKYIYLPETFVPTSVRDKIFTWNDNNANEYNKLYIDLTFFFTGTQAQAQAILDAANGVNTYISSATLISAEDYASKVADGTLVTGVSGTPARYFVYGYNKCDAFYNGNHQFSQENTNDCAGLCSRCNDVKMVANPKHNYKVTSLVYTNYKEAGVLTRVCQNANCEHNITAYVTEADPIITSIKGYSTSNDKKEITFGYSIDTDALEFYNTSTGKALELGFVVAVNAYLGGNAPLASDGTVASLEKGTVIKATTKVAYNSVDFRLTGIWDNKITIGESETELKYVDLFLAGYIFDGTVNYVNKNGSSTDYSSVTAITHSPKPVQ